MITSVATGRQYQVTVALPRGYKDSIERYPVVYALDANGQFGTVVEAARLMRYEDLVPDLIIVGIGYPVGRYWSALSPRLVDLTPTSDPDWVEQSSPNDSQFPAPEGSGGAPGFMRFLVEELIPLIHSEYRVKSNDRALYGHSAGGLFCFYALLQGDGVFQRFIIASPSLWWDDGVSFDMESKYHEAHASLPARVFLSVGALEETDSDEEWAFMVSNVERLVRILEEREYAGLDYDVHFFEDETHSSVIAPSISRGLRLIYRNWQASGSQ